ncbi:hypothetical protein [Paracoccus seriniphilus]|uniref:hypothetical protein n=1 Tax=Paracoccus seriniphilus TaxID=184748 RepID=UPI00356736E2
MLIFWKHRLVFLATPKTGSTAIEVALESLASGSLQRPAPLKHSDFHAYHHFIGPWLKRQSGVEFDTVALMREPVEWLRSWYRFKLRDDLEDPQEGITGISFDDFVGQYVAGSGAAARGIGSQADFLTCAQGRVDRIFRYEQIDEFVHFLEERMDCRIELPRVNVPPAVKTDLPPSREQELRAMLSKDLALYASL